jgi:hypothetical protein
MTKKGKKLQTWTIKSNQRVPKGTKDEDPWTSSAGKNTY